VFEFLAGLRVFGGDQWAFAVGRLVAVWDSDADRADAEEGTLGSRRAAANLGDPALGDAE
jgi:hypothetical protein